MSKFKKWFAVGALALSLGTVVEPMVYATTLNREEITNIHPGLSNLGVEIPKLEKVGMTYETEVTLANGETAKIEVTKVSDGAPEYSTRWFSHWHTRKNVGNGTYHVNVILLASNAGFYIDVHNKRITAAYDPWFLHAVGSTSNLAHEGDSQATLYFNFQASVPWLNGPSWTGAVRARIENGNLVTYVQ